ncbi:putative transcription factor C2H2 family [Helianthus anomalus]
MVIEIVTSGVILVVGIAIFVVIHVCIVGRTFGSMNGGTTMVMISRSGSMSEEDIKKLPSYDFNMEAAAEKSTVKCVVCLERFKSGEKCKLLPNCNHSFHGECIDSWLIKTGACPICRAVVDLGSGQTSFSNEVELELR